MTLLKNDKNNVITLKSVQTSVWRVLFAALKDILLETNICFTPDGMRIVNMDKSHTILVHLLLQSCNFEFYECKKEKITIAVNMFHLFKLISIIDNNETLTMYIEDEDYNDGIVEYLGLRFENPEIKQCRIYKLKLIEPDQDELKLPDVMYNSIISLPSSDFQKLVRDLSHLSEKLEIESVQNTLVFCCRGEFAEAEIIRSENEGHLEYIHKQQSDEIIQGEFSLKSLGYFIKCTGLCNQIDVYLGNNLPLIIKYDVGKLGELKLCLAPLPSM